MRAKSVAWLLLLLAAAAEAVAGSSAHQALRPRLEGAALVAELRKGGHVILARHMPTEPVAPDPMIFDVEDCETQRNLSALGRQRATEMGEAFRRLGIPVGEVLSSPYCRCLETARLAFGRVEPSELLSVFDRLPSGEKDERGATIRRMLGTAPPDGRNTVMVTHTGSLLYTFGLETTPEGIAHVFKPGPVPGIAQYVGMVAPDEWARFEALPAPRDVAP